MTPINGLKMREISMAWLGWDQILRCSQDDQVKGRAFAKPVLSLEPVEGSKDLIRQPIN